MYRAILENLEGNLWELVDDINQDTRMGLKELREALGGRKATVNYSGDGRMYANLPLVSFEFDQTDSAADIKHRIESRSMNITGAANLAGSIKDRINSAKNRIAQVSANTDGALAKLNDAADSGDKLAKQIESEAADLLSQLGQFSNGAPE